MSDDEFLALHPPDDNEHFLRGVLRMGRHHMSCLACFSCGVVLVDDKIVHAKLRRGKLPGFWVRAPKKEERYDPSKEPTVRCKRRLEAALWHPRYHQ
jgi:hypothetical protein